MSMNMNISKIEAALWCAMIVTVCSAFIIILPARPPEDTTREQGSKSDAAGMPNSEGRSAATTDQPAREAGDAAARDRGAEDNYAADHPEPVPPLAGRILDLMRDESSESLVAIEHELHQWGRINGRAAIDFALQLPTGEARNRGAFSAFLGWAEWDLHGAAAHLGASFGMDDGEILSSVAAEYARRDPARALGWAMEKVVEEHRNSATYHVMQDWGRMAPESALGWVRAYTAGLPAISEPQRTAVRESISHYSLHDLESARTLVPQLRANGAAEAAAHALVDRWPAEDLAAAGGWLDQLSRWLPNGNWDEVFALYAHRVAERGGDLAEPWLRRIADASLRDLTEANLRRSAE
jgi:hypothetical protein